MQAIVSFYKYNPTAAFSVDWYIGKRCNFACSYCVDYLHDYSSPHVPLENMKHLVDLIYDKHKDNVFWSLTGGEPTIHPNFLELCEYIKNTGAKLISVTTNGSRNLEYHKKLLELVDGITLSFHFEFMEHRIDEYLEKCVELEKYRIELNKENKTKKTLQLRFMVETSQLENIEFMEKYFRHHGIDNIEHRYIRNPSKSSTNMQPQEKFNFGGDDRDPNQITNKEKVIRIESREKEFYKEDELDQLEGIYNSTIDESKKKMRMLFVDDDEKIHTKDFHYNEMNFSGNNRYQGWLCWAGVNHIKITPDGDIYIGSCHVGGKRGNMFDIKNVDLPKDPIQCTKWRCTDNTDLKVPKIRDWKFYNLIKDIV